jgi:hypothetical protein
MKKQAAKKTADAASNEAPKLPKTAKRLKARKAIKEKALEAPKAAPRVTKEPAPEVTPTPAPKTKKSEPKKKEAPVLLPEAERRELRTKNMAEYNTLRKAIKAGARAVELEKLKARMRVLGRIYVGQNLKELSNRK